MIIKIQNKYNIIPITLFWLWLIFSVFLIFKVALDEQKCGTMIVLLGAPTITILFALCFLLIISVTNLFSKEKYYTDHEFISIPFLFFIGLLMVSLLV